MFWLQTPSVPEGCTMGRSYAMQIMNSYKLNVIGEDIKNVQ